jgi:ubiquinone/menaquinone biosynthesis C-methylase UbiE
MDFKRASHDVWERMAPAWDEGHAYFEQTARPVTERMVERLDPRPGQTLLELAAGTGIVGFAAAARGARVVVSDFSEAMVAAAQRRARELGLDEVSCRVLDAEALDLPDAAVDGVACRWGYMLMGDPAAALRETRRVLRESGRAVAAVFGAPERNPWVALPSAVLRERGHLPEPGASTPGILALADESRLRALVAGAGFAEVEIEAVGFTWRYADLDAYWRFLTGAAGALAMVLARLNDAERAAVRTAVEARLDGRLELGAECLVVTAS